jgi:nucleoside-diphosphate-sugar epimerase
MASSGWTSRPAPTRTSSVQWPTGRWWTEPSRTITSTLSSHAGALHKPDIPRYPTQAFIDVNVTGTLNLLETAAAAGINRFVFTSTTSLMITEPSGKAWAHPRVARRTFGPACAAERLWSDELAAEGLCRLHHLEHGLNCVILRTGRFFPEEDDTHRDLTAPISRPTSFCTGD